MYVSRSGRYKITQISGHGLAANAQAHSLLVCSKKLIQCSVNRYQAARNALVALDSGSEWKARFLPLTDSDLKGPNGFEIKDDTTPQAIQRCIRIGEGMGEGCLVLS